MWHVPVSAKVFGHVSKDVDFVVDVDVDRFTQRHTHTHTHSQTVRRTEDGQTETQKAGMISEGEREGEEEE